MKYHMLYVESRKSFKVKREKIKLFCRVLGNYTRQTYFFAECQTITLGKHVSLLSAQFCLVFFFQFAECRTLLSVFASFAECNYFAECFFCSTRQRACLPSVRQIALVKTSCTRLTLCFRQCMVDNYRYWQQKGNMTVFLN